MKETPYLTEGDDEANVLEDLIESFGVDEMEYLKAYPDEIILTKEIINARLSEVVKTLELDTINLDSLDFNSPNMQIIFYSARLLQILGVLIMQVGAHMPEDLRQKILLAATPKNDGYKFHDAEFQKSRNEILKKFYNAVQAYKSGEPVNVLPFA